MEVIRAFRRSLQTYFCAFCLVLSLRKGCGITGCCADIPRPGSELVRSLCCLGEPTMNRLALVVSLLLFFNLSIKARKRKPLTTIYRPGGNTGSTSREQDRRGNSARRCGRHCLGEAGYARLDRLHDASKIEWRVEDSVSSTTDRLVKVVITKWVSAKLSFQPEEWFWSHTNQTSSLCPSLRKSSLMKTAIAQVCPASPRVSITCGWAMFQGLHFYR